MEFSVGEVVYNKTTGEQGRIVRVMDAMRYVVSVVLESRLGRKDKEALWHKPEITRQPDAIPPMWRRY